MAVPRIPKAALSTLAAQAILQAQRITELQEHTDDWRLQRDSLVAYVPAVHRTDDNPPQPAFPTEHIRTFLEVIEDDSLGNTVIIAPPGSAKTLSAIAGACWSLGRNPALHVGYLSNTGPQANARSVAIRDTISSSPEYRAIFPEAQRDFDKSWTEARWFLWRPDRGDKDPSMLAAGTGGPIQGARMDRIFLDDIADLENMATEYQRQKVITWLNQIVKTRLTPQGRMVMICTRWHADDPAGWAIKEGWRVVRIKAIQEAPDGKKKSYWPARWPLYRIDCMAAGAAEHGQGDPDWEPGEDRPEPPCWVERDQAGAITRQGRCLRSGMSQREFNLTYQGDTVDDESALFKRQYWKWWPAGQEFRPTRGALFVDLAHEEKTSADFTSIGRWLQGGPNFLLTHQFKKRWEFPEVVAFLRGLVKPEMPAHEWPSGDTEASREVLRELARLGRLTRLQPAPFANMSIVVENVSNSKALIQTLRREVPGVIAWNIQSRFGTSKMARAQSILHLVEHGYVYLPEGAAWTGDFIEELAAFRGDGKDSHDDQVDTTTMALLRFTGGGVLTTTS